MGFHRWVGHAEAYIAGEELDSGNRAWGADGYSLALPPKIYSGG